LPPFTFDTETLKPPKPCLDAAKAAFPTSARVWFLAGELSRHRGNSDQAVGSFERALALGTNSGERLRALSGLASCCADTGRTDDAESVSRRMIALSPNAVKGYELLVNSRTCGSFPDDVTQSMVRLLGSGSLSRPARMRLHYALGKVCDSRGDFGEAFAHFALANGIRGRLVGRFNTEFMKKRLEATTEVFDSRFISAMSDHGCHDDFLICVVGFPRSGTTLIEQILGSHPDVRALGERTDFRRVAEGLQFRLKSRHRYPRCCTKLAPRQVSELASSLRARLLATAPSGTRVVTKHPGDCWEVGLIKILFPGTRFVYCRRHPTDNCLSCYMQSFVEVPFSTDLDVLAEVYRLTARVMSHWQKELPGGSLFDCSYESVVADPEPVIRRLHDHCGIPFNENWSRFHGYSRRIDTASRWQVRRPIYGTSVERWRKYAQFLGPLLQLDGGSRTICATAPTALADSKAAAGKSWSENVST
jgi:tetratricopeptide (TPR) repeat protein